VPMSRTAMVACSAAASSSLSSRCAFASTSRSVAGTEVWPRHQSLHFLHSIPQRARVTPGLQPLCPFAMPACIPR
jgi:hypothetical protein